MGRMHPEIVSLSVVFAHSRSAVPSVNEQFTLFLKMSSLEKVAALSIEVKAGKLTTVTVIKVPFRGNTSD